MLRIEKLPNVPGKSVTAIMVNYAPGAKSDQAPDRVLALLAI